MRATKINKNQEITFLFWLKRMQHTALVSKNKNNDEYKRQFKSIWVSISVNSRISFLKQKYALYEGYKNK